MSKTRKRYMGKLTVRCLILAGCALCLVFWPRVFDVLEGNNFFRTLSPLHLLWLLWVADMLPQIFPLDRRLPLGSAKLFANRYQPARQLLSAENIKRQSRVVSKKAFGVLLVWCALLAVLGAAKAAGLVGKTGLFMVCVVFYICDLICVLVWCPFRLMLGTRCCTTCRIFNWDHFMMFSPMIFVGGFYGLSLLAVSLAVLLVWELAAWRHPERFWERTNSALRCASCTDKLCTQYCRKRE